MQEIVSVGGISLFKEISSYMEGNRRCFKYFICSLFSFSVLLPLLICCPNTFRFFFCLGSFFALKSSKSAIVFAMAVLEMVSDLQQICNQYCRGLTLVASLCLGHLLRDMAGEYSSPDKSCPIA